jgi:hypothetical protein
MQQRIDGDIWWVAQGRIEKSISGLKAEERPMRLWERSINSVDLNRKQMSLVETTSLIVSSDQE